jgi:hypothetical protein
MKYIFLLLFTFPFYTYSQEDLLNEIDTDSIVQNYESASFKDLKIVNFESTKLVAKNEFSLIISHRFGSLKNGINTFFGLDDAVTRINFVYGVSNGFNFGISRSSFSKIYESSLKYRLFRQEKDGFPFTIVGFNSILINTALDKDIYPSIQFRDKFGYTAQLLIARKINTNLSIELAPTLFHENFVLIDDQENTQIALGLGGRYKLSKRWSLNADYGLHLNRADSSPFKNPLSIGVDLETGGHVFQMHFTNAQGMNTNTFIGQTLGDWTDGDVYFGFNLSRRF